VERWQIDYSGNCRTLGGGGAYAGTRGYDMTVQPI
jgi:hypothetical protein